MVLVRDVRVLQADNETTDAFHFHNGFNSELQSGDDPYCLLSLACISTCPLTLP